MFLAIHKESGSEGIMLLATSKGRLKRQLTQIGQDVHDYNIERCAVVAL